MKFPAGIVTEPVAGQLPVVDGVQESAVFAMEPGAPVRRVTVMAPDCCE